MALVPVWIISAHQIEKQKNKILLFFTDPAKIVKDFKWYIEEIEAKNINALI